MAILIKVKNSSLARIIDRMQRDVLIKCIENVKDKRVKIGELTEAGRLKIEKLMPEEKKISD